MENHLHMIASAADLGKEIANFKSFTARQCIDYYVAQKNKFILRQLVYPESTLRADRDYHFWQAGVHPQQIQDEKMMRQKIEYIHQNPVRRGYVDEAIHWRYSSARNYAGMDGLLEVCREW
jgi:REP element-mobilizing transposase RayT